MALFGALFKPDPVAKFIRSAKRGQLEKVRLFLASGGDVNAKDKSGATALLGAAIEGRHDVVSELLQNGAHVDAKTAQGLTPLMGAANVGHTEIVRVLLDKGADVNARATGGQTPLAFAHAGRTPLDFVRLALARVDRRQVVINLLLERGAVE